MVVLQVAPEGHVAAMLLMAHRAAMPLEGQLDTSVVPSGQDFVVISAPVTLMVVQKLAAAF